MSIKAIAEKGYYALADHYVKEIHRRIDFILQYKAQGNKEAVVRNQEECAKLLDAIQKNIKVEKVLWDIIRRFDHIIRDSEIHEEYEFYLN